MRLIFQNDTNEFLEDFVSDIENALSVGLKLEGVYEDLEISLTVVSSSVIHELNRDYRGVDSETDVLSFPLWNGEFENDNLLGDIVISIDKVKEQAEEYGHSVKREFIYLVIHSLLHLLGYDHITEEDKEEMRISEKRIMKELEIFK